MEIYCLSFHFTVKTAFASWDKNDPPNNFYFKLIVIIYKTNKSSEKLVLFKVTTMAKPKDHH